MKTYVLTLSEAFPKTHSKSGQPTHFKEKFTLGQRLTSCDMPSLTKIHTIRANYPLWEKRIKKVQEGNAVLSICQWTGKPYRSKQVELATLTAEDGVGIQRLRFLGTNLNGGYIHHGAFPSCKILANNDGLSLEDWENWFRGYDLSKPMAIIHFTKFRY